jgi:hypothetical protein
MSIVVIVVVVVVAAVAVAVAVAVVRVCVCVWVVAVLCCFRGCCQVGFSSLLVFCLFVFTACRCCFSF